MGKVKLWTEEEDAFLIREYGKSDTKEIAEALGRPISGVRSRAARLKLTVKCEEPEDIPDGYKYCIKCQRVFPLDSFWNRKDSKDGKRRECIECCSKKAREKRDKIKDEKIKQQIFETNRELIEKTEWKNSQTFVCKECGKELPGTNFSFNNNGGTVNCRCNSCRAKMGKKILAQRIKDGKGW